MKLRITTTTEGTTAIVKIAGKLLRDGVGELEALCASLEGEVVLDLADLRHADDDGVGALRSLRDSGAELRAVSRYIELLLSDEDG